MATTGSLAGALIMGAYSLTHAGFEEQRWQIYVVYIGYTCIATALNIWGIKILPFLNKSAISWSLLGAAVIAITCLACSSGDYSSPEFVFTEYINETGWNNGVAWILGASVSFRLSTIAELTYLATPGLLQSSFGLTGYDAVSHMVEEMPNPSVNAPKAMVLAVIIGSSSSFVFLICLLFCIKDVDAVISGSSGALLGAMYQATGELPAPGAMSSALTPHLLRLGCWLRLPPDLPHRQHDVCGSGHPLRSVAYDIRVCS